MNATRLSELLETSITHRRRVLIKGAPGVGKSDIVAQVCGKLGADLQLMHPAISDPTDFKGMPALTANGTEAHFLPFGDLARLCNAKRLTVAFLDDIGQAAPAVQAALMQLILARSVNGTHISDEVTFLGATNDTTHCAGVSGMIEPLKSRWDSILQLDVDVDAWSNWALDNNMPPELVAFIRFRPALLSDFKPTRELRNSPCPRTWASVGRWLQVGVKDLEVLTGAVGEGAATEFIAFLSLLNSLPSLDAILLDPSGTEVPDAPAARYAVATGLARKASPSNLDRVLTYVSRISKEFEVLTVKDSVRINKTVTNSPAFVAWAARNANLLS